MKERPILFNAPMVRALLDGSKTQTRRVMKPQPHGGVRNSPFVKSGIEDGHGVELRCPYGQPGDQLWVRETWQAWHALNAIRAADIPNEARQRINYPASGNTWDARMRPSLHMPRWASRILLDIVSVRIERLQDISEADAEAEGIDFLRHIPDADETLTAKQLYMCLWESINGAGSWDANPWVWVIEFKRTAA